MMNEMITQGIKASAIETRTAKSSAWPLATRDENTKKMGNGDVVVVNLTLGFTVFNIASYMY